MERCISDFAVKSGMVICSAVGNEANERHHFYSKLEANEESTEMEIRVGANEKGFSLNIWGYSPDKLSVSVISPLGERIERIQPIPNYLQTINLGLSGSRISIFYSLYTRYGVNENIRVKFDTPVSGVWKVRVWIEEPVIGIIHAWLPITNFLDSETFFFEPDPYYTAVVPSTANIVIPIGGYNYLNNSIYVSSGRGPDRFNRLLPLIIAPAVNISAMGLEGEEKRSGTSIATAIAVGASALFLEWGIQKGNEPSMNTVTVLSNFIRGAKRSEYETYPNNIWGYGILDLYASFQELL